MRPSARVLLIAVLPLVAGACAPMPYDGAFWTGLFGRRPAAASSVVHDSAWDGIGALNVGQEGTTPSGTAVRVEANWQSALGQPCKRLGLVGTGHKQLLCQGATGWFVLRDVAAENDNDTK